MRVGSAVWNTVCDGDIIQAYVKEGRNPGLE